VSDKSLTSSHSTHSGSFPIWQFFSQTIDCNIDLLLKKGPNNLEKYVRKKLTVKRKKTKNMQTHKQETTISCQWPQITLKLDAFVFKRASLDHAIANDHWPFPLCVRLSVRHTRKRRPNDSRYLSTFCITRYSNIVSSFLRLNFVIVNLEVHPKRMC